ncbi:MAG: triose-phosphate isomerase [Gemmatimonadetes bacterium]|jgi:triosephosphate isomerase (TIM)|nr:triose-phosphate isomerase [Gemmatimonadota bacterium]
MRRPLVAGNWKMNLSPEAGSALVTELLPLVAGSSAAVDVVVCPPYTSLAAVAAVLQGGAVTLGAQNCHWEEEGAFTGEVAPGMLLTVGCQWVILGHSERRQFFGESDEDVRRRAVAALAAGLRPIICIGETLEERDAGRVEDVVLGQLDRSLQGLSVEQLSSVAVAYEPVWAIGTGRTATPAQAQEVHGLIRDRLRRSFGDTAADGVRIQYGGSMKPDNAAELMAQTDIDGGLIGGASLKAADFSAIANAARDAVG